MERESLLALSNGRDGIQTLDPANPNRTDLYEKGPTEGQHCECSCQPKLYQSPIGEPQERSSRRGMSGGRPTSYGSVQSTQPSFGSEAASINDDDEDDPTPFVCSYCRMFDHGSCTSTRLQQQQQRPAQLRTYKSRWYILAVFALLALMQGGLCNVWVVVAESAEAAFHWSDKQVSLMQGWLYIMYLLTMFPFTWLMDKQGLRIPMILCSLSVLVGAGLRCVSAEPPYVTWLANAGHIANGIAAPVAFTAGPVISSLWFPPYQRATATAIATVAGFAGNAASFIVGPLVVDSPTPASIIPPGKHVARNYTNIDNIKLEILHCRYAECAVCGLLFLAIVAYFPSRPRHAPSITASTAKEDLFHSFVDLFRRKNANFWLVALPYGFTISMYAVWSSLFDVNLKSFGVTEEEAGWMGFYAVTAGCVAAVVIGRIADLFVGNMKTILLLLNVGCILSTYGFILFAQGYVPFSKVGLFVCSTLQGLFVNGGIPLIYEMSIETTYPVAEVATSGVLNILYNVVPLLFLSTFLVPKMNEHWMNWLMFGSLLLSFPMFLFFKEQYRRLAVDTRDKVNSRLEEGDDTVPGRRLVEPPIA